MPEAGSKAVTLGRLLQAGFPVPPGFVVTAGAFARCAQSCSQGESVERAVRRALEAMPEARLWAVRSSATAEDLPEASFAGQYESFLNVPVEEVLDRVRRCWSSLSTPRAVAYRARDGIPHRSMAMAVIVQQMVPAERAGVLFTADPVTGDANCVVVEGARGLGDQVVSGHVRPERVVLSKVLLEVLERTAGGEGAAAAAILDDGLARRLAELSLRVQGLLGGPLDIEWAACGDEIYLLQARPVTGGPHARNWEARQFWTNVNTGEVMPDVTTPVTWSLLEWFAVPWLDCSFRLFGADISRTPVFGLVAGRFYFNVNSGLALLKPFGSLRHRLAHFGQAVGGGDLAATQRVLQSIPDADLPDLGFRWPQYVLSWPGLLLSLRRHSPARGDAALARFKATTEVLVGRDIATLSPPELVRFVGQLRDCLAGLNLLHLVMQTVALPVLQLACRRWLKELGPTGGQRLFAGLGGIAVAEAGLALWRLALLARGEAHTEAILAGDASWAEIRGMLQRREHGRSFLAAWDEFMAEHGHHGRGELELYNARWAETPDYVLGLVRNYLRGADHLNPLANQQRLADERRRLTEQCRGRLKNPIKRWLFSWALRRAQKAAVNREEWKNQVVRQFAAIRRALLRLGQLLQQQGVLAERDDVFFLGVAEIEALGAGAAAPDLRERIQKRREEYAVNLRLHPRHAVFGRFTPKSRPRPQAAPGVNVLEGIAVSPGVVTGRARLVLRSDNHAQVLPGEILVAPFTDPAWTPYFVSAAGVVVDQGGVLSHGSIVAREYGLPAVTNLGSATHLIRTGDLIRVDGDGGRVTILERAG